MKKDDIVNKVLFTPKKELEVVSKIQKLLDADFFKAVTILSGVNGKIVVKSEFLPIVEGSDGFKQMLKVISDGDIRRFLLSDKFSDKLLARDTVTIRPKTIKMDESLETVLVKIELYKTSSLSVVNQRGQLVEIVTMHDIVEKRILRERRFAEIMV